MVSIWSSCKQSPEYSVHDTVADDAYIDVIISLDTLGTQPRLAQIDTLLTDFRARHDTANVAYLYLKGYNLSQMGIPDSARLYYERMRPEPRSEYALLREHSILHHDVGNETKISSELVDEIYEGARLAEELHSRFTYRFYDLLARTYFINRHTAKAKEYSDLYVIVLMLIATVVLFAYNTYRRRILLAKTQHLLAENRSLQLEQKTRQMQLNPHFIYNAIANMQGLISNGQKDEANNYLMAFSKLVRNVLELNRQEYITLEEEISSLENYLQLQRMRFGGSFDYKINVREGMDTETYVIPPMIIQPFAENAIEHGFKNLTYKGLLEVNLWPENDKLKINITDNGSGVGSQAPAGKKSLSGSITQERLDLLFNLSGEKAYFEAKPIAADGKTGYVVDVTLPLLTD